MGVLASLLVVVGIVTGLSLAAAQERNDLRFVTLSTRPDTVSGGDVLVRVELPRDVPSSAIRVFLNDHDVTSAFGPDTGGGSLMGLVQGLRLGENSLEAQVTGRNGKPTERSKLKVTNYPITGPIFSGPHETPFFCGTQSFRWLNPASTQTLGPTTDPNCSIVTRVDYVYRSTAGTFKVLTSTSAYPADLAQTTTSEGRTVPYIVRVETGTINRAIYQTAILHDPTKEAAPTPFTPPAAWNRRLVYTLGGGCIGGWYIQGSSIGNGGILEDLMLRQGYGVASSTLNVFGNNCQEVLAAESLMMVKERFIENFGPALFTIGYGCSGGSEQAHPISDDYPGLLDGIIVGCSFPEVTAAMVLNVTDADVVLHYRQHNATVPWTDDQIVAVSGYPNVTTLTTIGPGNALRTKAQGGTCNALVPVSTRYDRATNPHGVRCDMYDHMVNLFGRDPATGFARRTIDNVGVQYGLGALNAGAISKQQFLDLNQNIGGYDNDGNYVSARTVADPAALDIAYRTGRVTYGGQGLRRIPIIDYRGYVDQPENGAEVHSRFHSFSLRERLLRANGDFDNHVMLVEDGRAGTTGLFGDTSPVLSHALTQMDEWLTNVVNDDSHASVVVKMRRDKPADLVDACFTNNGTVKIAELQVYRGDTACNRLYPAFSTPRMVAGEPLTNDVLKCQLKPIDFTGYAVTFTPAEQARLRAIFPGGVCDYSKPGVGQVPFEETWAFF
jgi:uncharacterized tannase-like protein DUF6351